MYYNICFTPGYFIASTLTLLDLTLLDLVQVKRGHLSYGSIFKIPNTGSFFGPYKEEEAEKLRGFIPGELFFFLSSVCVNSFLPKQVSFLCNSMYMNTDGSHNFRAWVTSL